MKLVSSALDQQFSLCVCFQDVGYFILASVVLAKKTKQKQTSPMNQCSATERNTFFKALTASLKARRCDSGRFSSCQSESERSGRRHVKQNSALMQCTKSWLCQCNIYHL